MNQDVFVDLAPILHGRLSKLDVIGPEATAFLVIGYERLTPGRVFSVISPGYSLELYISNSQVILKRNSSLVEIPLVPLNERVHVFILMFRWSHSELGLTVIDKSGKREKIIHTPPTFPPHAIREWARRESLAPVITYESPSLLYGAVLDQLQQLRDKIIDTNAINGFWDIQYEGNKIKSRKPKRETDIHPQIRLLLYDLELQKGLQITPEYITGAGRLDFLVSGRTHSGQIVNVCLEFKLAHATDLAHGLQVQLPEYMERRATDFGIYCVLNFGQEYPADTSKFDIHGIVSKDSALDFILPLAASHTGRPYLKSLMFDLSRKTTTSKA